MSSYTEYYYTARPSIPACRGKGCYCFYGTNQLNDLISDTESESKSTLSNESDEESEWAILNDGDWAVSMRDTKFRHPRVLLSYFTFVDNHNELALPEEMIEVPRIPKGVFDYIMNHISLREPPACFMKEIAALKAYLKMYS